MTRKKRFAARHHFILRNEEEATNVWTLASWIDMWITEWAAVFGRPLMAVLEFEKTRMRWNPDYEELQYISDKLIRGLTSNPKSGGKVRRQLVRTCDELVKFSDQIPAQTRQLASQELVRIYLEHARLLRKMLAVAMLSTLMDFPDANLVAFLRAELDKKISVNKLKKSSVEYLSILSTVPEESIQQKEHKSLLKIAQTVQRKGLAAANRELLCRKIRNHDDIKKQISNHAREYAAAYYGYRGPVLSERKVIDDLSEIFSENKKAGTELHRLELKKRRAIKAKKLAKQALHLAKKEKLIFKAAEDVMFMKAYRRDAASHSFFRMEPILKEVARRANMPKRLIECATPQEIKSILEKPVKWKAELTKRSKYCVYSTVSGKAKIYIGRRARSYSKKMTTKEEALRGDQLKGQCGCPGRAIGVVKIIDQPKDISKMNKGDILVSTATQPDLIPAIKKAAAIVTNVGGITSHAAIVSRELNIPCVIDTKAATRVLKDGDRVEVDATKGIVRKL